VSYAAAALAWQTQMVDTAADEDVAATSSTWLLSINSPSVVLPSIRRSKEAKGPPQSADERRGVREACAGPSRDSFRRCRQFKTTFKPVFKSLPFGLPARVELCQEQSAASSLCWLASCHGLIVTLANVPCPGMSLPWEPAIHLVLFVHRVDGLAPGLYMLVRDPAKTGSLRLVTIAYHRKH